MSINWNKEIKMKDMKRFFNQEINPEIDVQKVAQTVAMIAIFGLLPAYTYGVVLGTLEDQRLELMSEVGGLRQQAAVVSAVTTVSTVSLDKTSYEFGETINITYNSASTTLVNVGFYDENNFLLNIATSTRVVNGVNKFSYDIPAKGPNSSTNVFRIKVIEIVGGKTAQTSKFNILPSYMQVTSAGSQVSKTNVLVGSSIKEVGSFTQVVNVKAVQGDVRIPLGWFPQYSFVSTANNASTSIIGSWYYRNSFDQGATSTSPSVVVVRKGETVQFGFLVKAYPAASGMLKLKTNGIYFSTGVNGPSLWTKGFQNIETPPISLRTELSNLSASYSLIDNGSSASVAASVSMGFTFNNIGGSDLYVSKMAGVAFATTSTITAVGPIASSSLTIIQTTPATVAGDTLTSYVIPSGTSRAFTVYGVLSNKNGRQAVQEFKITKIFYSNVTNSPQKYYINSGLENLRVTPTI